MKPYEDPINFDVKQYCGDDIIQFERMSEIGQGSPVIGDMYINGRQVPEYQFGGPILCDENNIYAPVFIKRFFTRGIKLAIVDRKTLQVKLIGGAIGLIYLYKIEGDKVFFYEDVMKTTSNFYTLA